ncbi:hypothetical protein CPHO_08645 [Corynebacterium phocae]|uniref:Uncharacterized protein n=1 Tax=Corynebacterium phocae TaxID=161895 RepID=A0A1L7D482_9CORY|nr:DUF6882 domain-containing protein [Corynebacterium phocae]APT92944.1 hypothetical protein CPHO_08645 [Corynebacterium phocae]KAA8723278.1 hypothetical protein F4V58_08150 [Corynebacterium phocae]
MHLTAPVSFQDVLTDGLFLNAALDLAFDKAFGRVSTVEYNFHPPAGGPDAPVDVRITSATGIHDLHGTRVAVIEDEQWTWLTESTAGLDIPELSGTHAYSTELIHAARTVNAGHPVFIAEQGNHLAAVSVTLHDTALPWGFAVANGLGQVTPATDERRAFAAMQAALGIDDETAESAVSFAGDKLTSLPAQAPLRLDEVVADGHYRAAEQCLLYSGRFGGARLSLDWNRGLGLISHPSGAFPGFEARAHILATVSGGVFTWAWANPKLVQHPMARLAGNVRRFGFDHGIPALLRGHTSESTAKEQRLVQAAMRIVNVWTLETVKLDGETTGLVLVDAPQLQLPPLHPEVRAAVLRVPVAPGVDRNRALAAYEQLRQLQG